MSSNNSNPTYSNRGLIGANVTSRQIVTDDPLFDEETHAENAQKAGDVWACTPDRTMFWSSTPTEKAIPPGLYKCIVTDRTGHAFRRLIVSTDDLIMLDDDAATTKVFKEVEQFWKQHARYRRRGFLHKRGILMYGDPGSGKTSVIQQLIRMLIKSGGIAVYADDPHLLTGSLQILRQIEPNRPVIVILEDFETLTERSHRENEWLSVLDGEAQIDNVVFLATTNYLDKLDKRFTDRPSRFDTIMKVPMPSAKARALYLVTKVPFLSDSEIHHLVAKTMGMSIAHLKELVVAAFCLNDGENMTEAERMVAISPILEKLRTMHERKLTSNGQESENPTSSFGFHSVILPPDDGADINLDELRIAAQKFTAETPSKPTIIGHPKLKDTAPETTSSDKWVKKFREGLLKTNFNPE